MKTLYVTWGEVPRLSSVYGGQVVDVVQSLQRRPEIEDATLLAGVPFIHSGLVREKWRYPQEIAKIRSKIGADHFLRRTIFTPPVGVHPTRRKLPFFLTGHMGFLARTIRARGIQIVQCRSYVATLLALRTRQAYGLDVKVIFDSRSYMADEAVLLGRWELNSPDHLFWLDLQTQMLRDADLTTVVSATMKERFDALGAKRCEVIHLNVDQSALEDEITRPSSNRPLTLAYAGYLDEGGWHQPGNLWRVFADIRRHHADARLLVITRTPHEDLRTSLRAGGFADLEGAIDFTSAPSPRDVVKLLVNCDAAILSYRTPTNDHERLMARSVFATKTAEYLMAGLPVLVNASCGGAASYVTEHNAGVAYDPEQPLKADDINRLFALSSDRARIAADARNIFSLDENARRLVGLCAELLGQGTGQ